MHNYKNCVSYDMEICIMKKEGRDDINNRVQQRQNDQFSNQYGGYQSPSE